jgi:IS5 family transposase
LSKGGRPPFDPVFMLKVLVLQKYYDLSDEQTKFQIGHRFSFMQFLGLQPGDSVPDEKTIWDFKGLLDKDGGDSARKLFECFTSQLSSEGMIACAGSIVDASFVDAPRQRNSCEQNAQIKAGERPEGLEAETAKGRQKDCDAPWTMKNTETHYGYKNHTKVDAKSKFVLSYKSTAASVHDSQVLEDLIDDEDQAMFADSAYTSKYSDERLLKNDYQNCIQFKARRGHPLTAEEIATNKLRSRIRVRCEHIFGRMSQMALDRIRSTD